ncbi:MAG: hypothetical protein ACI8PZ_000892 [Myxococcota bacterium]|jgi:hypothetical protein
MLPLLLALAAPSFASSHREAPAITHDPAADITDFYMFVSPEDPSKLILIMNVNPLEEPGGGPNFHGFDDLVKYNIHIDNEGDGQEDITFGFVFESEYQYPEEFLYNLGDINDPAFLNHRQRMTAAMWTDGALDVLISGGADAFVAPANVGHVSGGDGGYNPMSASPGSLTTTYTHPAGEIRVFAGPRQEGFYVDLGRTFDLLDLAAGGHENTLLGKNVHTIAVEVPLEMVTRDGALPDPGLQNEVISAWASTTRPQQQYINDSGVRLTRGREIQVARLGMPLVNEVAIPVGMKDLFNAGHPSDDGRFLSYVTDPILPIYMEAVLGVPNPISHDEGLGIGGREDLVLLFLTGHPALGTLPGGFELGGPIPGEVDKVFGAFEALRINLSTPSGFPNGRLPADDVVDVALDAMAGLLIDGTMIGGDGVGADGLHYLDVFPFLGDPWSGNAE